MNDYTDHRNDAVLAARLADAADLTDTAEISTRELLALASDIIDNVAHFEASMGVTDTALSLWQLRRILDAERNIMMNKSAPVTLRDMEDDMGCTFCGSFTCDDDEPECEGWEESAPVTLN